MFQGSDIKPLAFNLNIDGVTQSLLVSWMQCERLARFKIQGWYRPAYSEALTFGNYFHEYLDVCLNMYKRGELVDPRQFEDASFTRHTNSEVTSNFKKEYTKASTGQQTTMTNQQALVSSVIPEYFSYWKEDFFGDRKKNWTQIEQEFNIQFNGVKVRGKRDAAFLNSHEEEWLSETKTKSRFNEDVLQSIIPKDFQVLVYMLTHFIETGKHFKGVLYNVIRRPQLRKKVSEGYKDFITRCMLDIKQRPQWYFCRYEIAISEETIINFSYTLNKLLLRFIEWRNSQPDTDHYSTQNCTSIYGACPMLEACHENQYFNLQMKDKHHSELGGK